MSATEQTFHYKVVASSWGISVLARGRVDVVAPGMVPTDAELVGPVALRVDPRVVIGAEERTAVELGLVLGSRHASAPSAGVPVLTLNDLRYHLADYQHEGLTCAVAGLFCVCLGFAPPKITTAFDTQQNRYIFDFPGFSAEGIDPGTKNEVRD